MESPRKKKLIFRRNSLTQISYIISEVIFRAIEDECLERMSPSDTSEIYHRNNIYTNSKGVYTKIPKLLPEQICEGDSAETIKKTWRISKESTRKYK